jgi:hypothetical protein
VPATRRSFDDGEVRPIRAIEEGERRGGGSRMHVATPELVGRCHRISFSARQGCMEMEGRSTTSSMDSTLSSGRQVPLLVRATRVLTTRCRCLELHAAVLDPTRGAKACGIQSSAPLHHRRVVPSLLVVLPAGGRSSKMPHLSLCQREEARGRLVLTNVGRRERSTAEGGGGKPPR